jgi:hypothetical protein
LITITFPSLKAIAAIKDLLPTGGNVGLQDTVVGERDSVV